MKLYTRVKATIILFYIDIECVVLQCFGGVCVWVGCLLLSRTSLESVAIDKIAIQIQIVDVGIGEYILVYSFQLIV